jgi:hypothetical protein
MIDLFCKVESGMSERKKKQDPETTEVEVEENEFVLEPAQIEVGSGYTLAVHYDENQKPLVAVKTYGQVDITQIKREILKVFPDAQLKHVNQTGSIRMVKAGKRKK